MRIGKINRSVSCPLYARHFHSFHEVRRRKDIVSVIANLLRENVLNDTKFKFFKPFGKLLRICFSLEHRCAHKEGCLDGVRFSGQNSFHSHFESALGFRIDDLIDALFFSHPPSFPIRTFSLGDTRNLQTGSSRNNHSAGYIDVAVKGVCDRD